MEGKSFYDRIKAFMTIGTGEKDKNRLNSLIRSRMALLSCSEDGTPSSVFCYDVDDFELNPYDGVHGGFICCLFDVGVAVTCCAYTDSMLTTTDINIQYLRPLPKGKYRLITEITHAGQMLVNATGKLVSETGNDIFAVCTVSYMKVPEGYRIVDSHTEAAS